MKAGYLVDADERLLGFSDIADTTRRNPGRLAVRR